MFVAVAELAVAGLACILLSVFDLKRRILPNELVLVVGGCALGFHAATGWMLAGPGSAVAGMLSGAGLLLAIRFAYRRLLGINAMGLGDVKLVAAAGLWIGWLHVATLVALASLLMLAVVPVLLWRRRGEGAVMRMRLPFGPALCAALAAIVAYRLVI